MPNSVWASDRLVYRAVEDSDLDFIKALNSNATDFTQASHYLPTPVGTKSAKDSVEWMQKELLGVLVCLPAAAGSADADAASQTTEASSAKAAADDNNSNSNKADSKPTPIGYICLNAIPAHFMHHRHTGIGLTIGAAHQGKGYGSEAIRWALEWAFMHANVHRVEIGAFEWNERAIKLYERLGFVPESRKRKHLWAKGRWWDLVELGMLEEEWRERYGPKQ